MPFDDVPMVFQCPAHESGGVQCEVWLTSLDQPHEHWISETTIQEQRMAL